MSKMEKEPLFSAKNLKYLTGPFSANNPVIVQILGICSALAVTVQLKPAIVMALSVTVVTAFSNLVMSLLRNGVPSPAPESRVSRRAGDSSSSFYEGFEGWDGQAQDWIPSGWT